MGHGLLIHEVSRSHTQRRTTVGRTPLDEWSARRTDLYLTTHNIHIRQTFMPPVGIEPTVSAGERPQTCTLDRTATGTSITASYISIFTCLDMRREKTYSAAPVANREFSSSRLTHKKIVMQLLTECSLSSNQLKPVPVRFSSLFLHTNIVILRSRYRSGVAQRVPGS